MGTVYRHFPTKEALQADLVRRKFEIFAANAREALEAGGDPWEAFTGLLWRNAEIMATDVAVQQAMTGSVAAWTTAAEARAELVPSGLSSSSGPSARASCAPTSPSTTSR